MHAADDRLEFAPPPQPALLRAFALAILAHLLLLIALTFGLHWQRDSENTVAEAELWSQLPQQAAPKEVPAPPPAPPPVVKAPPLPDPQVQRDAQIALERERQRKEAEEARQAELKKEQDLKRKQEAQRKQHEQELAQQQAEEKRKEDLEKEKKRRQEEAAAAAAAQKAAKLREENLKRMQALAGGTGSPSATGTAARASGPSASWGGRVIARVKPNIVFTDIISGNPEAVVTVRLAPDGTIVGKNLKKSSGVPAWDQAVLRALDKTETLPRDVDGSVPKGGDLIFRPND